MLLVIHKCNHLPKDLALLWGHGDRLHNHIRSLAPRIHNHILPCLYHHSCHPEHAVLRCPPDSHGTKCASARSSCPCSSDTHTSASAALLWQWYQAGTHLSGRKWGVKGRWWPGEYFSIISSKQRYLSNIYRCSRWTFRYHNPIQRYLKSSWPARCVWCRSWIPEIWSRR